MISQYNCRLFVSPFQTFSVQSLEFPDFDNVELFEIFAETLTVEYFDLVKLYLQSYSTERSTKSLGSFLIL